MTTEILKLTACHKWIFPLIHMVNTLDKHVCDKRKIANKIFNNNPISNNIRMTKERYIEIYCMISRIKQFGKIFEYITSSNNFKNQNIKKLSKLQKRIMRITLIQINIKNPNMFKEIGNVLNRLFIKDIALHICEYI